MPAVDLPEARAACRSALERELLLRSYCHDIAGAVMGTMGWVDLARMDGTRLPPQLEQGLQRMGDLVTTYRDQLQSDRGCTERRLDELLPALGLACQGEAGRARVSELRLGSALELAAPSRVELSETEDKVRILLFGLPDEALRSVASPHFDKLKIWLAAKDARLGVALLRVVVRSASGEVACSSGSDRLELLLPVA